MTETVEEYNKIKRFGFILVFGTDMKGDKATNVRPK